MIRKSILSSLLFGAFALQVYAAPALTPERPLTAVAERQQVYPVVATDGSSFLVAWMEIAPGAAVSGRTPASLFIARILPNGSVGEPALVSDDALQSSGPAIAFDGRDYVLAWGEPHAFGFTRTAVARVRRDLSVGPESFGPAHIGGAVYGMACASTTCLISTGAGVLAYSDVTLRPLDRSAGPLVWTGAEFFAVSTIFHPCMMPSCQAPTIRSVRWDSTASALLQDYWQIGTGWTEPELAWNGESILVIADLDAIHVARDGTPQLPAGLPHVDFIWPQNNALPRPTVASAPGYSLTWTGSEYLLLWRRQLALGNIDLVGGRLTSDGKAFLEEPFALTATPWRVEYDSDAATAGPRTLIVYDAIDQNGSRVYFRILGGTARSRPISTP
jgi:hypothetical protein